MAGLQESGLVQITLSDNELSTRQISSHNLQAAIEALYRDGICAITNAVDPAHLDKLNSRMVPEAKQLYANQNTHRNFGAKTGNIQQEPVIEPEYVFEDIVANPFAISVTECMLGPNPHLRCYTANTAFKADARQPVHVDVKTYPKIPFGMCVNIYLVDTSPRNGATEVWPGSHASPNVGKGTPASEGMNTGLHPDWVEERRKISPPLQPTLPKGALIIRDFRLWHAGMPNRTDEPRVMLATALFPAWYRSNQKFLLPKTLKGKVNWGRLVPCVDYVDEGYDYLQGGHDIDLNLLP